MEVVLEVELKEGIRLVNYGQLSSTYWGQACIPVSERVLKALSLVALLFAAVLVPTLEFLHRAPRFPWRISEMKT